MDEKIIEKMQKLFDQKNQGYAYIYPQGLEQWNERCFLSLTPKNIANFINDRAFTAQKITMTDMLDRLVCESGRFNYDSNLDPYIDFEKYGREKMDQENGLFTKEGYLVYHGENQEILNLLQETIGLKNDKEMENQRKDDWEL